MCPLYELAECLYPKVTRELEERLAIELVLSSASRCHHCAAILYDEEIMAGWQPEDSNLNTVCQYCDKATVPLLTATILDYRLSDRIISDKASLIKLSYIKNVSVSHIDPK